MNSAICIQSGPASPTPDSIPTAMAPAPKKIRNRAPGVSSSSARNTAPTSSQCHQATLQASTAAASIPSPAPGSAMEGTPNKWVQAK